MISHQDKQSVSNGRGSMQGGDSKDTKISPTLSLSRKDVKGGKDAKDGKDVKGGKDVKDTVEKPKVAAPKPAVPNDYVVPTVWEWEEDEGALNRPTAGARFEKKLPKGKHTLQLYSMGTPNGMKAAILLEELYDLKGVEYDAWKINIMGKDQFGSGFVDVNPNAKIPAMLDTSFDPPLRVFESGSILKYIAEKYDAFIPKDPRKKVETFNWLFWGIGTSPFLGGGFGHFWFFAPTKFKYAIDRYTMEAKRQFDVLDQELANKDYLVGDEITIADFAIWPWIYGMIQFYRAGVFLQFDRYENLKRWYDRIAKRPAVERGVRVGSFGPDAVEERHSVDDFDSYWV